MKWALIGASDIAETRMIPAIRARRDDILAVVSSSAEHGQRFAAQNDIKHSSTDLESVLSDGYVDAVYISSRNHLHLQQSISAAAAGKHVLCEKPIAVETSGVQRLLDTVASSGIIFAVNHHLPGAATHRTVRRLIADGAIGTPLAASVCNAIMLAERLRGWRLGTEQGSGVVLDITSHDASVLNAAMPARANTAVAIGVSQGNWPAHGIDAVMSSLTYGDVTVQTHDSYTIAHRATRFDVFGTNGAILGENIMTQDPVGEVVLKTVSSERVIDVGQRRDLYDIVLDGFADAVAGVGRPTVTGAEAANAFLVANAVNESISSGRAVEFKGWFVDGHPPA